MKRILTILAATVMTMAAMAVPAKKGATRTVTLADGSKTVLTLHGDEHYSYYKTTDGTPCQVENGRIRTITPREVSDTWASRKQQRLRMTESATGGMRRAGKPSKTTTGTQKGLVILVEFSDVKFTTPNPQTMFQRFFNEPGFNEYGMSASVRDYFQKQSYGKLTIDFDVVGPFTTKNNMEYYGKPVKDSNGKVENHDKNAVAMVAEGVDAAYAAGVDFSKYDWDGDGEVDQVFVIYAGYAEAQGADENTIWPHEYVLRADNKTRRYNNVVIDTYGCASELKGNKGSTPDGIGTACHEFSHCLGLPDMYDTSDEGSAFGMATWDVMDQGSYNDDSCTPAGYTSYERWFSRWLEPVELNSETTIAGMKPLATTPEAYVMYNEKNRNEYYLLENRQPVDFDKGLYGHGLLILHVDYNEASWTGNTVNVHSTHQRMTIIPADNKLEYSNRQLAGDPWPGTSGNTALTNYTTPAATLYNANTDGTKLMSKPVENITEDETAMTVSFVACRAELGVPDVEQATGTENGNTYTLTWPAVSKATGYELELTTTAKQAASAEESLVRTVDFSKCYKATAGFTDISSSLATYGLTGWSGSKLYQTPNLLRFGTSSSGGSLKSPTWSVPASADITIVLGMDKVKADAKGTISITYGNSGDRIADCPTQTLEFTVAGNAKQVFTFKNVRKDLFWMEINTETQMYLNYMAVYDGEWTAEQLGIETAAAPRRAATVNTYTTATNSITLSGLSSANKYSYRLRSLGEANSVSKWSEERTFEITAPAPEAVKGDANGDGVVKLDDIIAISYYIMGKSVGNFNEANADVNGDGKIDVSDIVGATGIVMKN